MLVVLFRLANEVWSDTKVMSVYFGPEGSVPYWLSVLAVTAFIVAYAWRGGMRASLTTDRMQTVLAFVLLGIVLAVLVPGLSAKGLPTVPQRLRKAASPSACVAIDPAPAEALLADFVAVGGCDERGWMPLTPMCADWAHERRRAACNGGMAPQEPQRRDSLSRDPAEWSELMARAQDGDGAAYRCLLLGVTPYVRAIASRAHSSPSDAEDTVQDILMTLHSIRHTYDRARPFKPWLASIAHCGTAGGRSLGRTTARADHAKAEPDDAPGGVRCQRDVRCFPEGRNASRHQGAQGDYASRGTRA